MSGRVTEQDGEDRQGDSLGALRGNSLAASWHVIRDLSFVSDSSGDIRPASHPLPCAFPREHHRLL